ncbi:MAG: nucleotidyltransferase domain-containing protein [Synechococcaceae cyanobacterium]|nr:nucleotidyltransferase domain-containing protein [Synechococcaceae cyanobacterium]
MRAEPDVLAVLAFCSRARGEARLASDLDLAVIVLQPQLTPDQKLECWRRSRQRLGPLSAGLDLESPARLMLSGCVDPAGMGSVMWSEKGGCGTSPAEDTRLLLAIVRRHLRSLRGRNTNSPHRSWSCRCLRSKPVTRKVRSRCQPTGHGRWVC